MTKKDYIFLRNGLRRLSLKCPARYAVLRNARRAYKGPNKRQKWEYQCNGCKDWWMCKQVQVDHIVPCGELTKAQHIAPFVRRLLFCGVTGLQVLCKVCHTLKTNTTG